MAADWQVYMIRCSDASLYTGIATDWQRRFQEHARGLGAKYFRGRAPVAIVFLEKGHNRSSASRREAQIKKLTRLQKHELIMAYERTANDTKTKP